MTISLGPTAPICDEHSVLLWQACAYADDLSDAARTGRGLTPAHHAMLEFLHHRLLPYLTAEERQLPADRLRDGGMRRLVIADHERLRADVDNIESTHTRGLLPLAATALVARLDRHARREESWLANPFGDQNLGDLQNGALPLLFSDVIDLGALPGDDRES